MPTFSDEAMEEWRQKRVRDLEIPDDLNRSALEQMLTTADEDLREEIRRFENASNLVRRSEYNLKCLYAKRTTLIARLQGKP